MRIERILGKLDGKVALVTGASRGIGRAVAESLAAEGAAVGVNYRSGKRAGGGGRVPRSRPTGGKAAAIPGDVAEYDQAQSMVQQTIDELGGLHILVNNAGISKDALIYNMEPNDWLDVMRINFGGVFNCTKASLDHFMKEREGVIVNVSSVMGEVGWIGRVELLGLEGRRQRLHPLLRRGAGSLRHPRQRGPAGLLADRHGGRAAREGRWQGHQEAASDEGLRDDGGGGAGRCCS